MDTPTNELLQQVINFLSTTGTAMAKAGWEIAVRQNYVYAVLDIIFGIVLLIVTIVLLRVFFILKKRDEENNDGLSDDAVFSLGGSIVFFALSFITFSFALVRFINPYWYTLKLILDTIK